MRKLRLRFARHAGQHQSFLLLICEICFCTCEMFAAEIGWCNLSCFQSFPFPHCYLCYSSSVSPAFSRTCLGWEDEISLQLEGLVDKRFSPAVKTSCTAPYTNKMCLLISRHIFMTQIAVNYSACDLGVHFWRSFCWLLKEMYFFHTLLCISFYQGILN